MAGYFNAATERMDRSSLDNLIDERIRYSVTYAEEHSPFYRHWFRINHIDPAEIRVHEDLLHLPVISGRTIREHQPPATSEFQFLSAGWEDVFTIQETSGTSGTPKSFFLTWDDWRRYAEKYSRSFVSQGFLAGDRVVVCASYGMNVGANTMTLAARHIGMTIIPFGKCDFASRVITAYRPTAIVGSVFKLLRLARRLKDEGIDPEETSVAKLVAGGESFASESRAYLAEVWGCPVYNTYGSTEGTMCGECTKLAGLHVPEDLVHLDIYDPQMKDFVFDGKTGRAVLTTLLPVGARAGTLLLNYDTEDTTNVLSRSVCTCGRTHMRIANPQRESESFSVFGAALNRVDVEAGVFQPENMVYLTGEYEASLYGSESAGSVVLRITLECMDPEKTDRRLVEEQFTKGFRGRRKELARLLDDDSFTIEFTFVRPGGLELQASRGRPKRLTDRRAS